MDNILIAHKTLQFIRKKSKGRKSFFGLKLDVNKAYDRVSWEFFLNMLRTMGFGQTWVNWVKQCIITVPFSVFVNGNHSLLQHAVFGKGIHSHPIYLYWWFRGFSYGLEEFAVNNICKGIAVSPRCPPISHLAISYLQMAAFCLWSIILIIPGV